MPRRTSAGPASDPELLILASLAPGPKHGYAVMIDVAEFSGVSIGPGTLYTAIGRLVNRGWIEPVSPSGRQRPYRLTGTGAVHLEVRLIAMREIAAIGLDRLRLA